MYSCSSLTVWGCQWSAPGAARMVGERVSSAARGRTVLEAVGEQTDLLLDRRRLAIVRYVDDAVDVEPGCRQAGLPTDQGLG